MCLRLPFFNYSMLIKQFLENPPLFSIKRLIIIIHPQYSNSEVIKTISPAEIKNKIMISGFKNPLKKSTYTVSMVLILCAYALPVSN